MKFGSTIRPELGRMDFSGIERGGRAYAEGIMRGSEQLGAGIRSAGASIGQAIEKTGEMKATINSTYSLIKGMSGNKNMNPEFLARLDAMGSDLKNEDIPLTQRYKMAERLGSIHDVLFASGMQNYMQSQQANMAYESQRSDIEALQNAFSVSGGNKNEFFKTYLAGGGSNLTNAIKYLDAMDSGESNLNLAAVLQNSQNPDGTYNLSTFIQEASKNNLDADSMDSGRLLLVEANESIDKKKQTDFGLDNPTVFILSDGSSRTYGLGSDGSWQRRVRNQDGSFSTEYLPEDAISQDAAFRASMNPDNFLEQSDRLADLNSGLSQLEKFAQNRTEGGTGIDYARNVLTQSFKTLLGSKERLTQEELSSATAQKQLKSLVGRFREEIVGPGVMTEQDANRIEQALGGSLLTGNLEVATNLISEIITNRTAERDRLYSNLRQAQQVNPILNRYKIPDIGIQSFDSLEEARKAGLGRGDAVIINGVRGTLQY